MFFGEKGKPGECRTFSVRGRCPSPWALLVLIYFERINPPRLRVVLFTPVWQTLKANDRLECNFAEWITTLMRNSSKIPEFLLMNWLHNSVPYRLIFYVLSAFFALFVAMHLGNACFVFFSYKTSTLGYENVFHLSYCFSPFYFVNKLIPVYGNNTDYTHEVCAVFLGELGLVSARSCYNLRVRNTLLSLSEMSFILNLRMTYR